jgi:hypothetical protein
MDDLEQPCPHCGLKCQYLGYGYNIEHLIEVLIPKMTDGYRSAEICLVDWIMIVNVWEDEALVGKITVNNWKRPEDDYTILNYFNGKTPTFTEVDYLKSLMAEIKMYYDAIELHDGEHPVRIKLIVNIPEKKNGRYRK